MIENLKHRLLNLANGKDREIGALAQESLDTIEFLHRQLRDLSYPEAAIRRELSPTPLGENQIKAITLVANSAEHLKNAARQALDSL